MEKICRYIPVSYGSHHLLNYTCLEPAVSTHTYFILCLCYFLLSIVSSIQLRFNIKLKQNRIQNRKGRQKINKVLRHLAFWFKWPFSGMCPLVKPCLLHWGFNKRKREVRGLCIDCLYIGYFAKTWLQPLKLVFRGAFSPKTYGEDSTWASKIF